MLTVVEEMDPGQPQNWQEAAAICVSEIFSQTYSPLRHLVEFEDSSKRRIVSSLGTGEDKHLLECVLEGLSLLENQFEGMVQTMNWFRADQMYWVEEWKILGSLAAAAGIKNGKLFEDFDNYTEVPDLEYKALNISASSAAGGMDFWMIENGISDTLVKKQTDYGHHNIARFGRNGIVVRCHDKLARLKNLHLNRSGVAANEALVDTYIDIIGYSAIGMMWERGWFLLDLTK